MASSHPLIQFARITEEQLHQGMRDLEYPFLTTLAEADSDRWRTQINQIDSLARDEFGGEAEQGNEKDLSSIVPQGQLVVWQKKSPSSWLICEHEGEIVGFVHVEPISGKVGDELRQGRKHEGHIENKTCSQDFTGQREEEVDDDILPDAKAYAGAYIHLGCIVRRRGYKKDADRGHVYPARAVLRRLLAGLVDRVEDLHQRGAYRVLAVDYPDISGEHNATQALKRYGFNNNGEKDATGNSVYILDLRTPNKILNRLKWIVAVRRGRYESKRKDTSSPNTTTSARLSGDQASLLTNPKIGVITALPKEYVAVEVLLDDVREDQRPGRGAGRRYLIGEIPASNGGMHEIALTLCADIGNNQASVRATLLLQHYPNIDTILMVGIAAGVPNPGRPDEHVRLGDVVVSDRNGIVQYDFDKESIKERVERHPPRPPSPALIEAVRYMEARELRGDRRWVALLDKACTQLNWSRPSPDTDRLAASEGRRKWIRHPADPQRIPDQPRVFSGPIASANKLLKNPVLRDRLREQFQVKAVEMEGSGIADATWNQESGYLVIRGICDYGDDNKNDLWQKYAAVAAAAYAVALLRSMPASGGVASPFQPAVGGEWLPAACSDPPGALVYNIAVISIHGIRTNGAWQKNLVPILNQAGFSSYPLDYGFFHAVRFLVPCLRKRQVAWFRDQYTQVTKRAPGARPSVVAHSFGTYIVARALELFPELKFDRIILCGSIVRPDYPWSAILDRGQAQRVLNDYGGRDFVVAIAPWVASDTGRSGKDGFNDNAGGRVYQRGHEEFSHSDYFYNLNYQETWVAFLRGKDPAPLAPLGSYPLNWRFLVTMIVLVMLVSFLGLGGFWWFGHADDDPADPPPPPSKRAPAECSTVQGAIRSHTLVVTNHTSRKLRVWHWTKHVQGEDPADEGWMQLPDLNSQDSRMIDHWRGGCHFIVIDDLDARLTKRRVEVGWREFEWDGVSRIEIEEGWKHNPDSKVITR